jgi:ABC-type transport system involved in multi-copper enzyme maturation permease subunit
VNAELLKLRYLPTPRVVLLLVVASGIVGGVVVVVASHVVSDAWDGPANVMSVFGQFSGIVLGAWMIGLEASERTMRRLALEEPARERIIANKAFAMTLVTLLIGISAALVSLVVSMIAAPAIGGSWNAGDALSSLGGAALTPFLGAILGFLCALLIGTQTGGLVLALGLSLVLAPLLTTTAIGDYTYLVGSNSIVAAIRGVHATTSIGAGLGTVIGWILVLGGVGSVRFIQSELP